MRVGLATIQYGRRLHLARQAIAVCGLETLERYVIVSMDPEPPCVPGAEILHRPAAGSRQPVARRLRWQLRETPQSTNPRAWISW
jgi:hypothetical protein